MRVCVSAAFPFIRLPFPPCPRTPPPSCPLPALQSLRCSMANRCARPLAPATWARAGDHSAIITIIAFLIWISTTGLRSEVLRWLVRFSDRSASPLASSRPTGTISECLGPKADRANGHRGRGGQGFIYCHCFHNDYYDNHQEIIMHCIMIMMKLIVIWYSKWDNYHMIIIKT